jgi:hypothetical protein
MGVLMSKPLLTIHSWVPRVKIKHDEMMEKNDWRIRPTKRAIEDLFTFTKHVRKILNDDFAKKTGIFKWIDNVENDFKRILIAIDKNELIIGAANGADNEEMDMIYESLNCHWSIRWGKVSKTVRKQANSTGIFFLENVIQYWVDEIKLRGWTIYMMLEGSEDCDDIKSQFETLDKLNFVANIKEDE